jgi:hypothetical protein
VVLIWKYGASTVVMLYAMKYTPRTRYNSFSWRVIHISYTLFISNAPSAAFVLIRMLICTLTVRYRILVVEYLHLTSLQLFKIIRTRWTRNKLVWRSDWYHVHVYAFDRHCSGIWTVQFRLCKTNMYITYKIWINWHYCVRRC